ncbi:MAG: nucleotidyltransferase domain-containing protein [Nitrospirae bacterium]|nr:nucleotidyltransferase domain-containing protein [Nitrospirota bacterium]
MREGKLGELSERLRSALGGALDRISLYGSRARDDWRPDSDWDVLVVLAGRSPDAEDRVLDVVTDFELENHYELCVSVQIVSRDVFHRLYPSPYAFWSALRRDEKVLWTRTSS